MFEGEIYVYFYAKTKLNIFQEFADLYTFLSSTFDKIYRLSDTSQGPISNDTVLVVDPNTGKIIYSWGSNR